MPLLALMNSFFTGNWIFLNFMALFLFFELLTFFFVYVPFNILFPHFEVHLVFLFIACIITHNSVKVPLFYISLLAVVGSPFLLFFLLPL